MIRLIYEMLKGINKNIDKNEQLKEKDRKNALEEEMNMYGLDEDEKELVDSFMRAKAVLPEEYLNRIDKIIKGLDPKVELEAILEFRNRKIKK